jgi:ankyrin repeat protein
MLLKSGADPNITEENGETALHIACRYGHIKLVRILMNDGSSPFFQSNVSYLESFK